MSAISLLVLVGMAEVSIAQQPNQPSAQVQQSNMARIECSRNLRKTPSGMVVEKDILLVSPNQPNKYDLLSSKARLSEPQKKSLKDYLAEADKCDQLTIDALRGNVMLPPFEKGKIAKEVLYAKLLNGQVSIGEANIALEQLRVETLKETMDAVKANH